MTVRLIATGGTFEKVYDPLSGELRFGDSHLPAILARARLPAGRFVLETVMLHAPNWLVQHAPVSAVQAAAGQVVPSPW